MVSPHLVIRALIPSKLRFHIRPSRFMNRNQDYAVYIQLYCKCFTGQSTVIYVLNQFNITRFLFSDVLYGDLSHYLPPSLSLPSLSPLYRGLFERDKIVFSFMLCAQIMRGERKISDVEWNFFLRGSSSMDREYPNKPDAHWLSDRFGY